MNKNKITRFIIIAALLAAFVFAAVILNFGTAWWVLAIVIFSFEVLWTATMPGSYVQLGIKHIFGDVPQEILAVEDKEDVIATKLQIELPALVGHDDVVFSKKHNCAFVTCMDGWIWRIDLETNKAERFFDNPMCAIGAKFHPHNEDLLLFCAGHLFGETYAPEEKIGIYQLNVVTKELTTLVSRVPNMPEKYSVPEGNEGAVYVKHEISLHTGAMDEANSHQITFPNDLDISRDGKRIYWAESCVYPGLTLNGGVLPEIITMGRNGAVWCYDTDGAIISLVGRGYCFADGIMLEYPDGSEKESSILITETSKCQITRLYIDGEKAGGDEAVWANLPALPDGLERDEYGHVWCSLLKPRSDLINKIHANPWLKPLILRLPPSLLSKGTCAGMIGFNSDCSKPLYYTLHNGPGINSISVCCSHNGRLYLPQFEKESLGLFSIENPLM